jgi:hypothetical protein
MEVTRITPEPDDAVREAILAALAAEETERRSVSGWAGALQEEEAEA